MMVEIDMLMLQFLGVDEYRGFNLLADAWFVCVSGHIGKQSPMLEAEQIEEGLLIMVIIKRP